MHRTSWGAVTGNVYAADSSLPVQGARVTVRHEGAFAADGRTVGLTDAYGRYTVQAPLGRVSANFDVGRALGGGLASVLLGGATNRTKRIDVTRLDIRVDAPGLKSYTGPAACREADAEKFRVRMEPVLLVQAGSREVSAPADGWGPVRVRRVSVAPDIVLSGQEAAVSVELAWPESAPSQDVVVVAESRLMGRRRMTVVAGTSGAVLRFIATTRCPRARTATTDTVTALIERCPLDVLASGVRASCPVQVVPRDADLTVAAVRGRALAAEHEGDTGAALTEWKAVCASSSATADDHRRLADAAVRLHDYATAAASLERFVQVSPEREHGEAIGLLAAALVRAGEASRVLSEYGPARNATARERGRQPRTPLLLVALGRSYLLTGRMDEARAIRSELAELKTRLPADAASFRAEMQLADALDGVKTSSGSAPAHASLGRTLLDLGRWEEGTRALEQALRLDPTRRAYAADLAYGLAPAVRTADLAEGDLSSAVEQAQRECVVGEGARATRSKDFRVWHRLAMLRLRSAVRTGDMASMDRDAAAKCVSALEEAVRSARSGARVNEGAFLGPLGYASARVVAVAGFAYPEAAWDHVLLEALRALLKDPGDAFGLLNLATSLVAVGESATALPALRALRQIRPDDPETDYVAAQMCFAGGDASEAERLTRRVLGSNPRHPRARPLLAQILADGGDWTGAAVLMATHQDMYGRTDPPPSRGTDGAR